MKIFCTRPGCSKPHNSFTDLDDEAKVRTIQQKYCTTCGMPLLLADRYIPSKLLGQGGFGAAFLACDRYKPKMPLCVVKLFQPSGDLDAQELAVAQNLFQREAVALEELGQKHPQIPNLYAFFTPMVKNLHGTGSEQYFYLAQEFIDGQDLETELENKGKFTEAAVREVLLEVLKVLQFVHDNDTIHRDIKPSNIMRHKRGLFYLLDFGAVKQIAAGGSNNKKSTGIYSMGFAPPEQMSGSEIYPSTDIYALAVTCITLLTGKPAEELYDSFNRVWQWENYTPKINQDLAAIINRMLLATPAQRFQSANEAISALEQTTEISPSANNQNSSPVPSTNTQSNSRKNPLPNQPVISTLPISANLSSTPSKKNQPRFSLVEVLSNAAFTGFEGALCYVSLTNVLSVSGISLGLLGMLMGGMIFALYQRTIEKIDLLIFAGITAGLVIFIPGFQGTLSLQTIFIISTISTAGAIAITAFFRLIHLLLSRFL